MKVDILCSENGAELARCCASVMGGQVLTVPFTDPDAAQPLEAGAAAMIASWDDLLNSTHQCTRFNSTRRFVEGATVATPDRTQSFGALLSTDRPRALILGGLLRADDWHGAGPVARVLPGLTSLGVPRSGIVTDGSAEALEAVVDQLGKLLRSGVLKCVEAENIAVGSPLHAALSQDLGPGCRTLPRAEVRFRRRLRDPETGEAIQVNSAKTRQGLRRKQRNLEKELGGDLDFVTVTHPDQTDAFVHDAAQIVEQTYQAAIGVGVTDDAAQRDYLRKLAAEGTLRGYMFRGKGQAVAYVLGDIENGTFHLWATSFLPDYKRFSPGIVLLNLVFEELTGEGVELFDFGHGEAAYKQQLGDEKVAEETLHIYGPGPVSRAAFLVHRGSENMRTRIRGVLVRSGRVDQLRNMWRNFRRRTGSSRH